MHLLVLLTSVDPGIPALGVCASGWREEVVTSAGSWAALPGRAWEDLVPPGKQNLHVKGFCSSTSGPHLNSHVNFISCSFSQRFRDNTSLYHRSKVNGGFLKLKIREISPSWWPIRTRRVAVKRWRARMHACRRFFPFILQNLHLSH